MAKREPTSNKESSRPPMEVISLTDDEDEEKGSGQQGEKTAYPAAHMRIADTTAVELNLRLGKTRTKHILRG